MCHARWRLPAAGDVARLSAVNAWSRRARWNAQRIEDIDWRGSPPPTTRLPMKRIEIRHVTRYGFSAQVRTGSAHTAAAPVKAMTYA